MHFSTSIASALIIASTTHAVATQTASPVFMAESQPVATHTTLQTSIQPSITPAPTIIRNPYAYAVRLSDLIATTTKSTTYWRATQSHPRYAITLSVLDAGTELDWTYVITDRAKATAETGITSCSLSAGTIQACDLQTTRVVSGGASFRAVQTGAWEHAELAKKRWVIPQQTVLDGSVAGASAGAVEGGLGDLFGTARPALPTEELAVKAKITSAGERGWTVDARLALVVVVIGACWLF
ncbi:hypothetical protein BT63DRAFT_454279 [Microthyrium microscopicum]|uniref:Uncharacterized protein n=1 Tax=Microthyrium microscopicum TaxID=703497 RepID=A0A6A6UCU5_9PEZI|nr:hypothetical protein BT63DRAFT_454279 [Microthyrium microscopicum]